jgi:hypothetical protein
VKIRGKISDQICRGCQLKGHHKTKKGKLGAVAGYKVRMTSGRWATKFFHRVCAIDMKNYSPTKKGAFVELTR